MNSVDQIEFALHNTVHMWVDGDSAEHIFLRKIMLKLADEIENAWRYQDVDLEHIRLVTSRMTDASGAEITELGGG